MNGADIGYGKRRLNCSQKQELIKMPDYMSKRSKEEKDKSARAVAKTIQSTTPTHGKPGSWGKEPGTFEQEALEPELEITEIIEEVPAEKFAREVLEPIAGNDPQDLRDRVDLDDEVEETPVEAEPEPIIEETVVEEVEEPIVEEVVAEPEETPKVDNTAEIAALRAKLAELEK